MVYGEMMTDDEAETYGKINTNIGTYMDAKVPEMIKNGIDDWDAFVDKINSYEPQKACEIYQKYVDRAMGK